jgi:hypothetical protein
VARLGGGAPAQRAPLEGPTPEELAADWSSGDAGHPEAEAAAARSQRGRSRGGKTAMASMPKEAKQRGRSHGGKNGSRVDKQRAGKLGGKRSGATWRAY